MIVEAQIFSGFFFPIAQIGKYTAMIILHFHLQPQFKYELFHIYFTSFNLLFENWYLLGVETNSSHAHKTGPWYR